MKQLLINPKKQNKMNFKINLWTLLFFIAVGAFIYKGGMVKEEPLVPASICTFDKVEGQISVVEGKGRLEAFKTYIESVEVENKKKLPGKNPYELPLDSIPQENRKVEWFKINEPCELGSILSLAQASGTDSIYASLAINREYPDDPLREQGMIDLVFKVKTTEPKGTPYVDNNGYRYYDFTSPCEPLCGGKK